MYVARCCLVWYYQLTTHISYWTRVGWCIPYCTKYCTCREIYLLQSRCGRKNIVL